MPSTVPSGVVLPAARPCGSPTVMPLLDVGVYRGQPFMVLQLVEGASLEEALRDGPLPIPEAVRIGAELAAALECSHRHHLLHGDVKPHNVLLELHSSEGLGRALLVDFGVARALEQTQAHRGGDGPLYGSLPYLAPEALLGGG